MTAGWAVLSTLRERCPHMPGEPCDCPSKDAALALVEAALDAASAFVAADKANDEALAALLAYPGGDPNVTENLRDAQKETARLLDEALTALAAALRAVREGK